MDKEKIEVKNKIKKNESCARDGKGSVRYKLVQIIDRI